MPRKPKTVEDDWSKKIEKMKTAAEKADRGDMPWMMTVEPDVYHELTISVPSITEHHDAGPKENWSCFRVDGWLAGSEEVEEIEVPFWAMSPFILMVDDKSDEIVKGELDLMFMRTKASSGLNLAAFR